jgi:hypothetical protein
MRKLGGIILLSALALTACSAPTTTTEAAPSASASEAASTKIAPLLAAPSPSATLPPEFTDESARSRFLEGVKKNWRGDALPSDDVLVQRGAESCALFDQGLTMGEIGERGGSTEIEWDNAGAIAVYASRVFCTQHNTDNI